MRAMDRESEGSAREAEASWAELRAAEAPQVPAPRPTLPPCTVSEAIKEILVEDASLLRMLAET